MTLTLKPTPTNTDPHHNTHQERFWPDLLAEMRQKKEFDHVLIKSDYWKKFEGTVLKQGKTLTLALNLCTYPSLTHSLTHPAKCKSAPKQSVETHSVWYLIPPADHGGVNWDVFPDDVEHVLPQGDGFRGFVVEFYNVVSDVVVQDGYQSVLNLRTVLQQIAARHPRIQRCSRETDGATSYNSLFVALFSLQLGQGGKVIYCVCMSCMICGCIYTRQHHTMLQSGSIRIVHHSHNEPGHGADICDTAGANCIRQCWRYTRRTGLAIICAEKTCVALREAAMQGFIHLQVRMSVSC